MTPASGGTTTSSSPRPRTPAKPPRMSRPTASALRSRPTSPPSRPASRSTPSGSTACARDAAASADVAGRGGRRRPDGPDHALLPGPRPRARARPSGRDRRPHGSRDDQPHAAHGRGRARRGPARRRRGDDAVARRPRADRGLEPRDGGAARRCQRLGAAGSQSASASAPPDPRSRSRTGSARPKLRPLRVGYLLWWGSVARQGHSDWRSSPR